ncbi:monovalent cation/H+ antiporter subunit D [Brevundimonas sp. PAMC22021]|uniref:monovalent cation/H+ antiporter subunit D n=1 Tax=Brevundimonas sp. PAMC22021 TaxID=2861285 RepID=UPI001C62A87B|nr:monovalent cation/H+ antiporter subunit D [Brevundimonas sp. PAMC22021]QYF87038.1 monovalent cation/H+ antiporter subunit D [Brevundimonas sp. PAMC22021]
MIGWHDHLIIGPIVLPLAVAAAMLLFAERRRRLKTGLSLAAMATVVVMALILLHESATGAGGSADVTRIYRLGAWAAPYGIVLVADRLSTLMIALAGVLGACALIFAMARWDRAGPRFHSLFLLLIMGVNGAVLTGDLFNLFVFFEIMLAASYGLVLHGSGQARIRASLAYIAVNLTASLLFLIGVSLIYGVTGTLNMADLAVRIPTITETDRGLFHVGAAVLGTAFLIKCAMWPTGFWLTPTYAAASAPAAAVFAILSKVGVYVVIRLSLLLFGPAAGASAGFGQGWLLAGGLATVAFGTAGLLASRDLARAAGHAVIVSSGTVLAIVGVGGAAALSGALFYLVGSTLACAALFLLAEILQRGAEPDVGAHRAVFDDEYRDPFADQERNEPGLIIPAAVAGVAGAYLVCVLMIAGLPPLSGFIGKLAMIDALARAGSLAGWLVIAILSLSSLGALIGLTRSGVAALWTREAEAPPLVVGAAEFTALAGLLGACVVLAIAGGPALIYAEQTADWLWRPQAYVQAVLGGGGR